MPPVVLELLVSEDGRYLDANAATFDLLGYTPDELRALPFGTLAGIDPSAAIPLWRSSIRDHRPLPTGANTHLVASDGVHYAVIYLGVRPSDQPDVWFTSFQLVSRRRVALNRPMIL